MTFMPMILAHGQTQAAGVVQKVTFLGNTDNVNFGWFVFHQYQALVNRLNGLTA